MSLADMTSARSSPSPDACPECDTSTSVTSDLHKYQVACTCKPASVQYACADDPGPPPPAKTDTPPALPPRPPATTLAATNRRNNATLPNNTGVEACVRRRKYAWWCVGCGALAAALGGLLAAAHILLRAYTASPHHLETVPAAVPAAMLVLTGVCIMSLARRRNRYSYMIKVVGACCLVCALTCVLVTITTTVIHMNKLQTLKFCEYTKLTRTCTCFSMPPDSQHTNQDEDGVRCVFEGVTDCGVVHGVLYWCLRGVFALSVTAVLVCIFSSMLAYQLLSHERKKMYWEQLELRCRSLYRPPSGQNAGPSGRPGQTTCSCCTQCHPAQPTWDISLQHRFWAPGRIGNLYSPNPGTVRKTSAWSWFPWPRSNSQNSRCRMGGVPQSGDSAYGFCDNDVPPAQNNQNPNLAYEDRNYPPNFTPNIGNCAQGAQPNVGNFTQNAAGFAQSGNFAQSGSFGESSGNFDSQTGVWGPPPPYSPQGRSGSRHHLHQDPATTTLLHHHHIDVHRNSMPVHDPGLGSNLAIQNAHTCSRASAYIPHLMHPNLKLNNLNLEPDVRIGRSVYPPEVSHLVRLQTELNHLGMDVARFSTLRGHLMPYPDCQRGLGMSMGNIHRDCRLPDENIAIECLHQKSGSKVSDESSDSCQKKGKENLAFQNDKHSPLRSSMQDCHRNVNQNAESEVYFADVSSCCNVSLKTDCCLNPNVSALVGTIENHPESTSESDTGSFTLTRQQRPQPQCIGSKRRPRTNQNQEKHIKNQEQNPLRLTEQQIEQLNNSIRMMNDSRLSDLRMNELSRLSDHSRMNDSRLSDLNSSMRIEHNLDDSRLKCSPKFRQTHMSPLRNLPKNNSPLHPRQSSTDSNVSHKNNPEFFVPPPPAHSPLTPNTEESIISDDDLDKRPEKPETSKCLAPDSQYEVVRDKELKPNHHHCYSDTNTMDSGWQSGSEKHVTD